VADVTEGVIENLQALGLSLYESRLYLGLLKGGAQNGNSLSKLAGVPSSKVYSTLDRLGAAGIVYQIQGATTSKYICVTPAELLRRLRSKYLEPIRQLEQLLPDLAPPSPPAHVLTITGLAAIVDHGRQMIENARSDISILGCDAEIDGFRDPLKGARSRGVRLSVAIYRVAERTRHDAPRAEPDNDRARIESQMLTVVADGTDALIAHVPAAATPVAVRADNPVLCLLAVEYVRRRVPQRRR
jgi:HTH-type transcriptional regulator, sugar sensing transcriptional regulator